VLRERQRIARFDRESASPGARGPLGFVGLGATADSLGLVPGGDRKYEPDEVALILRRIAELQVHEPPTSALSRPELEQVVAESGLDIRHLDTALAELETVDKRRARRFGLRLFVVVHRSVAGDLTPAKLAAAAALLDRSLGVIGDKAIHGNAMTWFGRHVAVSIMMEGSRISIQIEERFRETARVRLGLTLFSAVPSAALMAMFGAALALIPLGLYAGFRYGHHRRIESTERQLEGLANQLVKLLETSE
jgi:hypothetical protein